MTLYCALDKGETFAAQSGLNAHKLFCGCIKMQSGQNVNEEVAEQMRRL
jgi:hypothetical protein